MAIEICSGATDLVSGVPSVNNNKFRQKPAAKNLIATLGSSLVIVAQDWQVRMFGTGFPGDRIIVARYWNSCDVLTDNFIIVTGNWEPAAIAVELYGAIIAKNSTAVAIAHIGRF